MRLATLTANRSAPRVARAVLVLAALCGLGSSLGGCANVGSAGGSSNAQASMGSPTGATVAFDSIDGPPPQLFDRLVSQLDSEARLRNLAVVSRQDAAAYRVRGYLAAQIRGGKTTIAWVWDVYDRDQQRALRLSGEEPTGKSGRDAWANVDDVVLRRVAQSGLTGLSSMISGTTTPEVAPTAPAPRGDGPAIARADDLVPHSTAVAESAMSFSAR
jgi:hypothetical protein